MAALTAADVLNLWESAAGHPPAERALTLALGCTRPSPPAGAELTVGDRDRRLIAAYRGLFGPRATARVDCPACGELLELGLELNDFDQPARPAAPFVVGDCEVMWRLPRAADVVSAARARTPQAGQAELIRKCVVRVVRHGEPVPEADRPAAFAAELAEALARAIDATDPLTDVRIGLTCVRCGHAWTVGFDPGAFLWAELDLLAQRLLADVHRLARAYGWREADILALSAARRAAYLRMCGG
jgi:hypothetical protein